MVQLRKEITPTYNRQMPPLPTAQSLMKQSAKNYEKEYEEAKTALMKAESELAQYQEIVQSQQYTIELGNESVFRKEILILLMKINNSLSEGLNSISQQVYDLNTLYASKNNIETSDNVEEFQEKGVPSSLLEDDDVYEDDEQKE